MNRMDDIHWWSERLEAWSREGFNVDAFRDALRADPANGSELLIRFDDLVSKNRNLRRRVIDSTMPRGKKGQWLTDLDNVIDTENLLIKWEKDAALNRPWEPYIYKAESRWSELGRRSNLSTIVKRLNALDPSSFSACQPMFILFDDVSSESIISSILDEIENDEERRRQVVGEMIDLLSQDGIDASDARRMKINDALDHLSALQSKADRARNNRLRIEKEIRAFDSELADRLLEKRSDDLTTEVDAIIDNLSSRLSTLTSTVDEWVKMGIKFPNKGKILPQDLLDWEAGLPDIESAVEVHLRALERWKDFETLWPDKCANSSLAGRLDMTEEFVDMVDSFDQEWRELELEGMQIIGSWEEKGFAMDVWRTRVAEEPRSALAWLKREEARYQTASGLIDALMSLDASISGEDEIVRRVAILREFDLESDLLEEMDSYVNTRARRGARHRSMLESEWMDLVRKGLVDDLPTASLSLAEFETLIADSRLNKRNSGIPIERLESRMMQEIDEWYENGFTVDSLKEMLSENPIDLALRMTSIRESVAKHEQLRRRVSGLDWTRDPELSVAINLDLARPDRLGSLAADIPQLMMDLAQKKVVDADFKFVSWRPHTRTRPILIPVPKNTVEDAMEAILEDMESEEIEETIEEELIVEDVQEEIEIKQPEFEEEVIVEVEEEVVAETVVEEDVVSEEIEETVVETTDDVAVADSSAIENLLRALGLEQEAALLAENGDFSVVRRLLASHVGIEPRDMRLDRLLRLSLRLIPKGDENDDHRYSLLSTLSELAVGLSKWTRTRLESRHSGSVGDLLQDAAKLGEALSRIPGPGTPLPLEADEYMLPSQDDIDGLSTEVNALKRRVMLPSSGGVR